LNISDGCPARLTSLMAGLPSPASVTRAASLSAPALQEPSCHGPGVLPFCSTDVYCLFLRWNGSIFAASKAASEGGTSGIAAACDTAGAMTIRADGAMTAVPVSASRRGSAGLRIGLGFVLLERIFALSLTAYFAAGCQARDGCGGSIQTRS
jgi:hypothetical protein